LSVEKRVQCVRLYSVTNNASEVRRQMSQMYGPPRPKVQTATRINKFFDETGSVSDPKKQGRPRMVRTVQNLMVVAEELASYPQKSKSQRRLPAKLGIKRSSIQNIMRDMNLYPYRPRLIHSLNQRCTSRAQRTVCNDVCSSACTRANDATAWSGM
jgi:hypothetical protein